MGLRAPVVVLVLAACGHQVAPRFPDAPLELRDDADRGQAIDALWALPPGPARDAIRGDVARALARRIADALDEDQPFEAQDLTFELLALWRDEPGAVGAGLAGQLPLLHRLRATFAKSGASEPAIAVLAALAVVVPARRA